MTIPFPGHGNAVISVGRTKADTDGAWLMLDGELRSEPATTGEGGASLIEYWTSPRETYIHGFARPSATHAVIGFEDGSTDSADIVGQHFFYGVTPNRRERGQRPVSFTILDANGRVLDQVGRSTLLEAFGIPVGGGRLKTETPSP